MYIVKEFMFGTKSLLRERYICCCKGMREFLSNNPELPISTGAFCTFCGEKIEYLTVFSKENKIEGGEIDGA